MLNIFAMEDFVFIRIDIEKFQLINSFLEWMRVIIY